MPKENGNVEEDDSACWYLWDVQIERASGSLGVWFWSSGGLWAKGKVHGSLSIREAMEAKGVGEFTWEEQVEFEEQTTP